VRHLINGQEAQKPFSRLVRTSYLVSQQIVLFIRASREKGFFAQNDMSKQRYINTRFWDDGYVATLDPIEKLLFIYCLTNPLTEISGAYELPLRRIAFDTGIDKDMILKVFARFAENDKIHYRDGWIFLPNFIKHQSDSPTVVKGIETSLKSVPDWILDMVCIRYQDLSHLNLIKERLKVIKKERERQTEKPETATPPARTVVARVRDERVDHPAIQAVRVITNRFPDKALWDKLIEELDVPDLDHLRRCHVEWVARGFKPTNLAWAFEWYKNGIPEKQNGTYTQHSNGRPTSVDRLRATQEIINQYPTEAELRGES